MKPSPSTKIPSQRQLRVGEEVRHALADVIMRGDVHDPDLQKRVISILEVRMTPDLRQATVLVMPLGGKDVPQTLAALDRNARILRGEVSRRLRGLKFSPELKFRLDDRYEETQRMDKIFHELQQREQGGV